MREYDIMFTFFVITNSNVVIDGLAIVLYKEKLNIYEVLLMFKSSRMNARVGTKVQLQTPDRCVIKMWTILPDQSQLVANKYNMKLR